MDTLAATLRAAADPGRLRILRLLLREDGLNVGELTSILGVAQSTVSRQLKQLRKVDLVRERREGGFAYYGLVRRSGSPAYDMLEAELTAAADELGDLARLQEVLRARADRGEAPRRALEPGRSWVAWARSMRFLLPPLRVADFGCGDGALTAEIAAWAESVIAIDRDPAAVAATRRRVERAGLDNVTLLEGELAELSLDEASVDLAVLSHALHHCDEPAAVLTRAGRVLIPGGRLLVLELRSHGEDWVKDTLGHVRLGFSARQLEKLLVETGFEDVEVELTPAGAAAKPFRILIASGVSAQRVTR